MGPALTLPFPLLHKQCSEHAISLNMQPSVRQLGEKESGQRDKVNRNTVTTPASKEEK